MALIQKLRGNHRTFGDMADYILSVVLNESSQCGRIDVIFDVYNKHSIKDSEKARQGSTEATQFKKITPGQSVQQWRRFLACSSNKEGLIKVFVDQWQHPKHREKLSSTELCKDTCYKIAVDGSEEVKDLKSSHEEADTRLLLHVFHCSAAGYKSLSIVADDTDVCCVLPSGKRLQVIL